MLNWTDTLIKKQKQAKDKDSEEKTQKWPINVQKTV